MKTKLPHIVILLIAISWHPIKDKLNEEPAVVDPPLR